MVCLIIFWIFCILIYFLYFKDVTVGHNKCGAYGWKPVCCDTGYTATTGWDPVSGVGSPNVAALLQYVLSLP